MDEIKFNEIIERTFKNIQLTELQSQLILSDEELRLLIREFTLINKKELGLV